jgi:hypothetical protein
MMDFYFVTLEQIGASTILDCNAAPRFICFREFKTARVYAKYLSKHRGEYGKWPCINLSTRGEKIEPMVDYIPCDGARFDKLLSLSYKTRDDLDDMTMATGIQYFYCHEFAFDSLTSISMMGQDVDGEVDNVLYREKLDYSIKNL